MSATRRLVRRGSFAIAIAVMAGIIVLVALPAHGSPTSATSTLLVGEGPDFDGPMPIGPSLTSHEDCVAFGNGFACARIVWTHTAYVASQGYRFAYPGSIRFQVRDTSSRALTGTVTSSNTFVGVAFRNVGAGQGLSPAAFAAGGSGACTHRATSWMVPPGASRDVCVNFSATSGLDTANTVNQLYDVVFSGFAGWELPIAGPAPTPRAVTTFSLNSPAQIQLGVTSGWAGAWPFGGALSDPTAFEPPIHEYVASLPGLAPWGGWSHGSVSVPPMGPLVVRFAAPPSEHLRVLAPFADAAFSCGRSGCSIVRLAVRRLPRSLHLPDCTAAASCYLIPLPRETRLLSFCFVTSVKARSGRFEEQWVQAVPAAPALEASSLSAL